MPVQEIRMAIFAVLKTIARANAMHHLSIVAGPITKVVLTEGSACRHEVNHLSTLWWWAESDSSQWEAISIAPRVEGHRNQYHNGCPSAPSRYLIKEATWVVEQAQNCLPAITISSSISEEEFRALKAHLLNEVPHRGGANINTW